MLTLQKERECVRVSVCVLFTLDAKWACYISGLVCSELLAGSRDAELLHHTMQEPLNVRLSARAPSAHQRSHA